MLKLGSITRRGLRLGFGAFFIEKAMLGFGKGSRFGDVSGPLGPLGLGELREQLVGEQGEGLFFGGEKDPRDKKEGEDE